VRHAFTVDRPICELTTAISRIGDAVDRAFGHVDCAECLRRSMAEAEERARVLRGLLAIVEARA